MPRSVAMSDTGSKAGAGDPPTPPEGYEYPDDFRFKSCKRCGVWNCAKAEYDQSLSPECKWGLVIAWESGSWQNPIGSHCLLCRKAGCFSMWVGIGRSVVANMRNLTIPKYVVQSMFCFQ